MIRNHLGEKDMKYSSPTLMVFYLKEDDIVRTSIWENEEERAKDLMWDSVGGEW